MRTLVLVVLVLVAAGCGRHRSAWPDCLRMTGARHVRVATTSDLHTGAKLFGAMRAAGVDFSDGVQSLVLLAATSGDAAKLATTVRAAPVESHVTSDRTATVVRRGAAVLQWFGPRDSRRERALLDCAAS